MLVLNRVNIILCKKIVKKINLWDCKLKVCICRKPNVYEFVYIILYEIS